MIRGEEHLAVRQSFVFREPGAGYRCGSKWEQTLLFLPDTRYFLSCETITSANSVPELFYRIDMPGHLKHVGGDSFDKIYLSYSGLAGGEAFLHDFAPDAQFLYVRNEKHVPDRFIRAYRLSSPGGDRVWLAGMTLDPSTPSEAWCHQRGYVCFIQENHRRPVSEGETFGAAYVVGYFDSIEEMEQVYDIYRGTRSIQVDEHGFELLD